MPWQWISRLFTRDHAHESQHDTTPQVKQSPDIHGAINNSIDNDAINPVNKTSHALEVAFFCWLLDCTEADLLTESEQLHQKAKTILKNLDQEALSLDQLPRRPASFPMLIKLLNSDNASNNEIANTILSDPALATQTLKTANSPFFRTSNETIDSVERAVFILGSQGIRNIISATVMMPLINGSNSKEAVFSKKVWEWGLLSATASDQYSSFQDDSTGPIYLLGLLPALTYLLIYQSLHSYQSQHSTLGEIEPFVMKNIIQQRSWRLCHDICQQWGLPPSSNKYLLDAERPSPSNETMPLRDGIFIGTHKALQTLSNSPVDDKQVLLLISASNRVSSKVIQHLDERLK